MFDAIDSQIPSSYFAPIDHGLAPPDGAAGHNPNAPAKNQSSQTLSAEEQKQVQKLKARDQEVRAHEAAHLAAAGGLATSGATFGYQTGPDGQRYAVEGEVHIDVSPASTPEATIRKMDQVKKAALAPANPSSADQAVAAAASQKEAQARVEQTEEETTNSPSAGQDTIREKIVSENEGAIIKDNNKINLYQDQLQPLAEHFRKWV